MSIKPLCLKGFEEKKHNLRPPAFLKARDSLLNADIIAAKLDAQARVLISEKLFVSCRKEFIYKQF